MSFKISNIFAKVMKRFSHAHTEGNKISSRIFTHATPSTLMVAEVGRDRNVTIDK